ncbi:retrotransposon protein, putative, ty1-copia subclass [Tanacetum coccineum]
MGQVGRFTGSQTTSNYFCAFLLGRLKSDYLTDLINLRVASNVINARRLPLAPLVFSLVRPLFLMGRNLRIVLSTEDKLPLLEQPIPTLPVPPKGQANLLDVVTVHQAWVKTQKEIARLMLMTMDPDIQKNLEHLGAYDMLKELKTLYVQQADQELLQTVRDFHACKQEEGQSPYLGFTKEEHTQWQNYNMHSMGKTVTELHAMLKLHEQTLPPKEVTPALHAIKAGRIQKNQKKKSHKAAKGNQGKGKAKMGNAHVPAPSYAPKPKNPSTPKKDNPVKDVICHQCGEVGLGGSKKLKPGALSLYVGDGHLAAVEAIGEFHLFSLLYKDGFVNRFENGNSISVSKNNLIYFNAIPRDNIYEIVMSFSSVKKDSSNVVSNKRAKLNLDSALLWHCRLGHINKKRIEKLQHDGLLDSTDIKSFEKCVACMSGKMARKPYSHQVERAKDLLGLIHTDVCGPFKIMSRQRASYFVTFTNNFSRYGYVYLLKHKHEVFETFKVFQKEVENQLEKTIKSLRSDRGGEYTSQEFLDHLRDHGIIAYRTPSYTPQHTGVSERRNRTLLNMVRSMMSQTTLPKSFWDYALESAARILNMVPTKKVDKTPYEIWHGQAPKLSYLKVWGCEALVKHDTVTKPDKMEPRSIKCIFVGYPKETMGYSFYYPPENKVFVARNAEFLENSLINHEASGSLEDLKIIQEEDTHPSLDTSLNHEEDNQKINEPQSDINTIHRSTRTRHPTDRLCLYVDAEEHELGDLGEPANYKAALLDPESDKWLNAMNVEMQSMKDNEVWELVDLPPDGKTIGHKWLFKKKTDMDGASIKILIAIAMFYDDEDMANGCQNQPQWISNEEPIQWSNLRVLTVHGSDDSVVRVEEALRFAKVIPNKKLQIIEGANHMFSEHRDDLTYKRK